jgi:hypothetical protein
MPANLNEPVVDQSVLRLTRASMLAAEATAWNRSHPDATDQVVVHEISIHFDSGAGGALVLYQGDVAPADLRTRSLDFGRLYLRRVLPALNATGLLPTPLTLFGANGLHDDVMMYNPDQNAKPGIGNQGMLLRYGMLEGSPYTPYYISEILKFNPK